MRDIVKRNSSALHASVVATMLCLSERQATASEVSSPSIDVAILLDTSNSMDFALDAARLNFWQLVGDLTSAQPTPHLRVALLTYGNSSADYRSGWVRVESPLTENLDAVSQRLFELTATVGAGEYVGRALQTALEQLDWSESAEGLRLVFIGGNEAADQDPLVDMVEMAEEAMRRDIAVNPIYFGQPKAEHAPLWKKIAERSGGQFASVEDDSVVRTTPFDVDLADLGDQFTGTYLPLGKPGQDAFLNQLEQDRNARSLGPSAAADRAVAKASPLYVCDWDLLQQLGTAEANVADIDGAELPETMRTLTLEDKEAYVAEMRFRREELRQQIVELADNRRQYLNEAIELDAPDTFDTVVRTAIRKKAEEKGFYFPGR